MRVCFVWFFSVFFNFIWSLVIVIKFDFGRDGEGSGCINCFLGFVFVVN